MEIDSPETQIKIHLLILIIYVKSMYNYGTK